MYWQSDGFVYFLEKLYGHPPCGRIRLFCVVWCTFDAVIYLPVQYVRRTRFFFVFFLFGLSFLLSFLLFLSLFHRSGQLSGRPILDEVWYACSSSAAGFFKPCCVGTVWSWFLLPECLPLLIPLRSLLFPTKIANTWYTVEKRVWVFRYFISLYSTHLLCIVSAFAVKTKKSGLGIWTRLAAGCFSGGGWGVWMRCSQSILWIVLHKYDATKVQGGRCLVPAVLWLALF